MRTIVKFEGGKELEKALAELPRATAKNVARRALMKAADPIDDQASANSPEMSGKLERSVITGTRLTRRQRSGGARLQSDGSFRAQSKSYVEMHVGTALSRGIFTEFGTFKDRAQMWFTRAWEATKNRSLGIIKTDLGPEIEKAAARLRKKGKL